MDFDSLAAEYAVAKLFPGTRMVPGYPLSGNIRNFLSLYRDSLPLADLHYIDGDRIKHIYVVDCQHIERVDEVARKLISEGRCTYTVFDHHHRDEHGLAPGGRADSVIRPAGSTTTLLVNRLRENKMRLTPFEATLLAIGIYEDTGSLSFAGTQPEDALCVAYLLEHGADLAQVNNFITAKLNDEQSELFERLMRNSRSITVSGAKVSLAHAQCDHYIEGLATMTRRLLELTSSEAAVAVVHMRDRTHIVCRSDNTNLNVRGVATKFGGDGHPGAASAVCRDMTIEEIMRQVEEVLESETIPEKTAAQIMTTPVRTVKQELSMDEANRIMLRYGQEGLVVVDGSDIVGIVSRRDVDKSMHHKLGHAPVRGFMSRPVVTIEEQTTLRQIQEIMVKNDIGRLPVLSPGGELLGIVSRKDLLKTLYGPSVDSSPHVMAKATRRRLHIEEKLDKLDPATRWLFHEIGTIASAHQMNAYAVGGYVRDLFLERPNYDLDFVVEGSAIELANALEAAYPARFELRAKHDRFDTATLLFHDTEQREIDLSTARIEFYEFPAALPTVEASMLEQDLFRRDFTINALAISLSPSEYGDVIDYFNGIDDIEAQSIRVLHPFSFIEDPTRIVRAARFASRFGFALESKTRQLAEDAIIMGIFDDLGGSRLKEELKLILDSPYRLQALAILDELGGGLRYLATSLVYDVRIRSYLKKAQILLREYPLKDQWVVYLGLLLAQLQPPDLQSVMERLYLANEEKSWINRGIALPQQLAALDSSASRSRVYHTLHGHSNHSLAIAVCIAPARSRATQWIRLYLEELREISVTTTGGDLLKLGFPQGPQIREALEQLHNARLDGAITTQQDETEFIQNHYKSLLKTH